MKKLKIQIQNNNKTNRKDKFNCLVEAQAKTIQFFSTLNLQFQKKFFFLILIYDRLNKKKKIYD